ncbi:MAG: type I restriction-modification system subunit M [Pseudomonadota bacterium]|nr:type I restriction-modification system subunit M [Pseudomonadota bacterium]
MTNEEFKKTLWDTANKLRGSVSAAEYKYPVLGLVFLKYVSDMFDAQSQVIRSRVAEPTSEYYIEDPAIRDSAGSDFAQDKTFYDQDNVFWIPPGAHFSALLAQATAPDIAQKLDKALGEIEAENPSLKGVLYREFSRLALEPGKLGELMGLVARLSFDPDKHGSRDVFGEVYEYFLGQFAMNEGAKAGEFYTPKNVVNLLVEILAPFKGTIYDPACGSGGMFVQSAKFKDAHQSVFDKSGLGKKGDLAIHGQELMAQTRRLCLMNLAVHGLDGDLGQSYGSSFTNDQHKTLRADYILANPPFNISDWDGDKLLDDPRWVHGIPPKGNANFAWLQHMLARLSSRGRAGIVLANGSMSSQQSGEGEIRRAMVQADVVECMVALPGQLFCNTQIPVCLWFLSRNKAPGENGRVDRRGQILFIDARKAATGRVSRTQIEFTDADLQRLAQTYHRWRGTDFALPPFPHAGESSPRPPLPLAGEGRGEGTGYADEPGFCYSASLAEVEKHGFVLTPGRYVGAVVEDDDDEAFADRMERLTAQLAEQMAKGTELDAVIREKLGVLGYGV